MDLSENNKLIADYMGLPLYKDGDGRYEWVEQHVTSLWLPKDMLYSINWQWLMPVIDKIEYFGEKVIIQEYTCHIDSRRVDILTMGESKIEAVYEAVVKYIKEFNKNKGWRG